MKPTSLIARCQNHRDSFKPTLAQYRRSPITDYNYHSVAFGTSSADYVRSRPRSFWNITGDYYKNEARHDLWGEAALWAVLAFTAFLPLISNAHALMEFVRVTGAF